MELKDAEGWQKAKEANTDPYGAAVMDYAERWADMMEAAMRDGQQLEACANALSNEADTDGITGFMYGAAVSTLSQVWKRGEVLRRWHNLKMQIGTEGEEANESGGTLNPALLNLSLPEGRRHD